MNELLISLIGFVLGILVALFYFRRRPIEDKVITERTSLMRDILDVLRSNNGFHRTMLLSLKDDPHTSLDIEELDMRYKQMQNLQFIAKQACETMEKTGENTTCGDIHGRLIDLRLMLHDGMEVNRGLVRINAYPKEVKG